MLLPLLGRVKVPEELISKVSEDLNTTAVPDKVTPSLPFLALLAEAAVMDKLKDAAVPPLMELRDNDELMEDSESVVLEPLIETVAFMIGETVALAVIGWPPVVEIYGPDVAISLPMTSLPDDAKLTNFLKITIP